MGRTACTEPQCLYKGCTLPFTYHHLIPLLPYMPSSYGQGKLYLYILLKSDNVRTTLYGGAFT